MAVIELTNENFQSTIEDKALVLVDFWAPWCGPCRSFAPIYEKVEQENPGVVFAKVNTEDESDLAQQFQIRSIPTLAIFKEQVIVFMQPGMLPESALTDLVTRAQELDMEEVRAELARAQEQQQAANG